MAGEEAEARYRERKTAFKRRPVQGVFWWHMFDMLILGVPFIAIGATIFWDWIPDPEKLRWTLISGVIVSIALWRQYIRFSRFRCPQCRAKLGANEFDEEESIYFRCHKCQVDWETGFIHGSDL